MQAKLGALGDLGFRQAMQFKWVGIDKSGAEPRVVSKVEEAEDAVLPILEAVDRGQARGAVMCCAATAPRCAALFCAAPACAAMRFAGLGRGAKVHRNRRAGDGGLAGRCRPPLRGVAC